MTHIVFCQLHICNAFLLIISSIYLTLSFCSSPSFHSFLHPAAPLNMSGLYSYLSDRRASEYSEGQRRSSAVQACYHHHSPCVEDRPSQLQARLELLQSQLNRSLIQTERKIKQASRALSIPETTSWNSESIV